MQLPNLLLQSAVRHLSEGKFRFPKRNYLGKADNRDPAVLGIDLDLLVVGIENVGLVGRGKGDGQRTGLIDGKLIAGLQFSPIHFVPKLILNQDPKVSLGLDHIPC